MDQLPAMLLSSANLLDIDNPMYSSLAFHPRKAKRNSSKYPKARDGIIPIPDTDFHIGYRFYPLAEYNTQTPVILHFHGNAEVVTDWEPMIVHFHRIKCAVFSVDYRGYGWSTGVPLLSKVQSDAEHIANIVSGLLRTYGWINNPIIVHGRSLGSSCAIHVGHQFSSDPNSMIKGVIVESGIYNLLDLPATKMLRDKIPGASTIMSNLPNVFNHENKLKNFTLPLLVIHGEEDEICPMDHGQSMYDDCSSDVKFIQLYEDAGHNDLLFHHGRSYFQLLRNFFRTAVSNGNNGDELDFSNNSLLNNNDDNSRRSSVSSYSSYNSSVSSTSGYYYRPTKLNKRPDYLSLKDNVVALYNHKSYDTLIEEANFGLMKLDIDDIDWYNDIDDIMYNSDDENSFDDDEDAFYTCDDIKYDIILHRCKAYFKSQDFTKAMQDCKYLLKVQPNNLNVLKIKLINNILLGKMKDSRRDAKHFFSLAYNILSSSGMKEEKATIIAATYVVLALVFHKH